MPICPFCRKPVEPGSVWCSCGANLSRYPSLPVNTSEIKDWLAEYEPELLATSWSGGSLFEIAKKRLLSEQEEEITANTKVNAEVTEAKSLIENFLLDCRREGLAPTIDIGQLRRDRWRQWKRIPTEFRQYAPLKKFALTPGYFFETSVAKFKDEYCVTVDGGLYKHQLNAPDPFPLEELISTVPPNKLREALAAALLWLLKAKQQPGAGQEPVEVKAVAEKEQTPAKPKRGLRLPFGIGRKSTADSAAQETVEVGGEAETANQPEPGIDAAEQTAAAAATGPDATATEAARLKPEPGNGRREEVDLHLEKTTT